MRNGLGRRARWWLAAACLVLLPAAWTGWRWYAERRQYVGIWRVELPAPTVPRMVNELEFTLTGDILQRVRDETTGAVLVDERGPGAWRVSGERLQWRLNPNPVVRWWQGSRDTLLWDHALTWDGPDRLRLEDPSARAPVIVLSRQDR
jgi:hypothetical protein